MAFFRREKDSVEEYRKRQEAFRRNRYENLASGTQTRTDLAEEEEVSEQEETALSFRLGNEVQDIQEVGLEVVPPAKVVEVEDPLEKYRKGGTTVAKDTAFNGNLKSDGNLCIEGNFDGELESNATIFIASTASVSATVRAADVIVAGTLDGTVHARERFHAMPSSRVSGEINTSVLVVDQGSHITCRFAMAKQGGGANGSYDASI